MTDANRLQNDFYSNLGNIYGRCASSMAQVKKGLEQTRAPYRNFLVLQEKGILLERAAPQAQEKDTLFKPISGAIFDTPGYGDVRVTLYYTVPYVPEIIEEVTLSNVVDGLIPGKQLTVRTIREGEYLPEDLFYILVTPQGEVYYKYWNPITEFDSPDTIPAPAIEEQLALCKEVVSGFIDDIDKFNITGC